MHSFLHIPSTLLVALLECLFVRSVLPTGLPVCFRDTIVNSKPKSFDLCVKNVTFIYFTTFKKQVTNLYQCLTLAQMLARRGP